ncbi:hypothetical protein [Woodsholea maritima]|uniref:hypothetical protein n=1 Tax=Woodsholea maritima TaxID=240237 RepID=UPI00037C3875|nr:hypothetical protein [Woodsholea maritima]
MISLIAVSLLASVTFNPSDVTSGEVLSSAVNSSQIAYLSSDEISARLLANYEDFPVCHVFSADPEGQECIFVICYDHNTGSSWTESCDENGY